MPSAASPGSSPDLERLAVARLPPYWLAPPVGDEEARLERVRTVTYTGRGGIPAPLLASLLELCPRLEAYATPGAGADAGAETTAECALLLGDTLVMHPSDRDALAYMLAEAPDRALALLNGHNLHVASPDLLPGACGAEVDVTVRVSQEDGQACAGGLRRLNNTAYPNLGKLTIWLQCANDEAAVDDAVSGIVKSAAMAAAGRGCVFVADEGRWRGASVHGLGALVAASLARYIGPPEEAAYQVVTHRGGLVWPVC
jgi:hypothetical protein